MFGNTVWYCFCFFSFTNLMSFLLSVLYINLSHEIHPCFNYLLYTSFLRGGLPTYGWGGILTLKLTRARWDISTVGVTYHFSPGKHTEEMPLTTQWRGRTVRCRNYRIDTSDLNLRLQFKLVTPTIKTLWKEESNMEASLGFTVRSYLKKKNN